MARGWSFNGFNSFFVEYRKFCWRFKASCIRNQISLNYIVVTPYSYRSIMLSCAYSWFRDFRIFALNFCRIVGVSFLNGVSVPYPRSLCIASFDLYRLLEFAIDVSGKGTFLASLFYAGFVLEFEYLVQLLFNLNSYLDTFVHSSRSFTVKTFDTVYYSFFNIRFNLLTNAY